MKGTFHNLKKGRLINVYPSQTRTSTKHPYHQNVFSIVLRFININAHVNDKNIHYILNIAVLSGKFVNKMSVEPGRFCYVVPLSPKK